MQNAAATGRKINSMPAKTRTEFSVLLNRHLHPTPAWDLKCLKEYFADVVEGGVLLKFQYE